MYLEQAVMIWKPGDMIGKDIYPVIANNNKTTINAVERSVRAVIRDSWDFKRYNTGMVFEVFGLWALSTRPFASQMIAGVGMYVEEGQEGEEVED
jgi:hypothetical protein